LNPNTVKFLRYMIFVKKSKPNRLCKVQKPQYVEYTCYRSTTNGEEPRFVLCRLT
jgi:hypothetical protein